MKGTGCWVCRAVWGALGLAWGAAWVHDCWQLGNLFPTSAVV